MSSKWELKEKSTGELVATVEGDDWKRAQKKAFNKIKKNLNMPGFRKGQAPEALIKKQIPVQNILMDAVEAIANDVLSDGVDEHKLVLVDRPELRIDELNEEKAILKFICAVKPEVKLGEYKGLPIKKKATRVTQKDIDAEVERLQQRYADMVVKEEGTVENGDTAVIDFEGFKDGGFRRRQRRVLSAGDRFRRIHPGLRGSADRHGQRGNKRHQRHFPGKLSGR